MTLEDLVEEESRKEKYSSCDDKEVVCECGNKLLFKISKSVPMNCISITTLNYKYEPQNVKYMYECLYCGREYTKHWLSKKAFAAVKLLSNYDTDKLNDELYLQAIIELEEYLC